MACDIPARARLHPAASRERRRQATAMAVEAGVGLATRCGQPLIHLEAVEPVFTDVDEADEFLIAFGQAVRRAREARGMSQEDLGFEAELDRTYVSGIERGVRNPTVKSIFRFAKALGVPPSVLMRRAERGA